MPPASTPSQASLQGHQGSLSNDLDTLVDDVKIDPGKWKIFNLFVRSPTNAQSALDRHEQDFSNLQLLQSATSTDFDELTKRLLKIKSPAIWGPHGFTSSAFADEFSNSSSKIRAKARKTVANGLQTFWKALESQMRHESAETSGPYTAFPVRKSTDDSGEKSSPPRVPHASTTGEKDLKVTPLQIKDAITKLSNEELDELNQHLSDTHIGSVYPKGDPRYLEDFFRSTYLNQTQVADLLAKHGFVYYADLTQKKSDRRKMNGLGPMTRRNLVSYLDENEPGYLDGYGMRIPSIAEALQSYKNHYPEALENALKDRGWVQEG